jgi:hypothetical protein
MFPRNGGHNRVAEYQRGLSPAGELSVHTWMDADLRELAGLVQQTQASACHRAAEMEFALVFPDKRGTNVMRIVSTYSLRSPCSCLSICGAVFVLLSLHCNTFMHLLMSNVLHFPTAKFIV